MATIKKAQAGKKVDRSGVKNMLMEKYKSKMSIADNYDLYNKGKWENPQEKNTNIKKLKDSAKKDSLAATKLKSGGNVAKDGKWMQKAAASIKRRGTEGVCTGSKFGGPTCKPGSKRYNLAKTFKSVAKKKK
jgi:hypothetical protein